MTSHDSVKVKFCVLDKLLNELTYK